MRTDTKCRGRAMGMIFILVLAAFLLMPTAPAPSTTPVSEPVSMSAGEVRANGVAKPMVFYLHNDTQAHLIFDYSTTYIFDTNLGLRRQSVGDIQRVRMNFYLYPQLAGDMNINGDIVVGVYINTTGVAANGNLYAALYDVEYKSGSTSVETLIGEGGPITYTILTTIDYYSVTIPNVSYRVPAGHSLRLYIEVQGGASSYFTIWYGSPSYDSRVVIPSEDYMDIRSVVTKDSSGTPRVFFDPDAVDKTVIIEANLTDPFGGYDIYDVRVTLTGPDGSVIVNNESMAKVSGTPRSYVNIYQYQWDYTGYPTGTYYIHVWAVDNNGFYYYWHFEQFNYGPYDDTYDTYFLIGYKSTVRMWVYDAAGNALPGATVQMIDALGSVEENVTDADGYTQMLLYNGTYTLKILWNDNDVVWEGTSLVVNGVNETGDTVNVSGDTDVEVYADVGNLLLFVTDSAGIGVESAVCMATYPNGTKSVSSTTDDYGYASLGYSPGGTYGVKIYWKNVVVYSGDITVHFPRDTVSRTVGISAAVYYLDVKVLDNHDNGMGDLQVVIYNSNTLLVEEFGVTNATGDVEFRLPQGEKDIVIYSGDQVVYERKNMGLYEDRELTVHAWVYDVTFSVVDSRGEPVEDAYVYVYRNGQVLKSGITGEDGTWTVTLAKDDYDVRVYWMDTEVYSGEMTVADNGTTTLTSRIYYLSISLQGNDGRAVSGTLRVMRDNVTLYGATGTGTEVRLPEGTYVVEGSISKEMYLTGVEETKSQEVTLTSDTEVTLKFSKYPVAFVGSNLFYVLLGYILAALLLALLLFRDRISGKFKPTGPEPKGGPEPFVEPPAVEDEPEIADEEI